MSNINPEYMELIDLSRATYCWLTYHDTPIGLVVVNGDTKRWRFYPFVEGTLTGDFLDYDDLEEKVKAKVQAYLVTGELPENEEANDEDYV